MDVFKIIPQFFYDLIARVIPGLVAIFLYFCSSKSNWLLSDKALTDSSFFICIFFLTGGYVIGHLISPFVSCLRIIVKPKDKNSSDTEDDPYFRANYLSICSPGEGAACTKVFAEYEMYYGLAIVFSVYGLLNIYFNFDHLFNFDNLYIVAIFLMAFFLVRGGNEKYQLFCDFGRTFILIKRKQAQIEILIPESALNFPKS
jgi:hypothetical protein